MKLILINRMYFRQTFGLSYRYIHIVYTLVYSMNQSIEYLETIKSKATYKRGLAFIQKQVYDNKRGVATTTNGNEFTRLKKNVIHWESKLAEYHEEHTYLRNIIEQDQNDLIRELAPEMPPHESMCQACNARGEIIHYAFHQSPTWSKCEDCDGKGWFPEGEYKPAVPVCEDCEGHCGHLIPNDVETDREYQRMGGDGKWIRCETCDGKGRFCKKCSNSGNIICGDGQEYIECDCQ